MKKAKKLSEAHTSNSPVGMGDYYGTGVKQKTGRIVRSYLYDVPVSNKKTSKPPRSLA